MDKMRMESKDITAQNIEKIEALFPNCITESPDGHGGVKKSVNFEMLKQMLLDETAKDDEVYEFTWVGKKAAAAEVRRISRKTLRPCPEESRDWDTTENLYLEGENLEILKLLQESYLGSVKMIYIDPPYNTGHDFIYPDLFLMDDEEYNEGTGYFDEEGHVNYRRKNGKLAGRYHSDWCSMMYPRLILARNLLREDGVIFISINDTELFNLQKICCEVFGDGNFLACFPRVTKRAGKTTEAIAQNHDYVLAFGKSSESSV
nr:site-specific DNA-methyltransferase [uncultured Acetatifactor sp.]